MNQPDVLAGLRHVMQRERTPLVSQRMAAEHLASHGRLLVHLPTGGGKTLLAALPFAAGLVHAPQMIFMTPLRTLASAQASTLRREIDASTASGALHQPWNVREQTGNVPEDPLFTACATVCTFDQALSSALQISYSTSQRRRTVNAGAVLASYLVADELHLFPRNAALTTLLWLLRNRPELPFCLMTATLSVPMIEHLADLLDAHVLDAFPEQDIDTLGLAERRRTLCWHESPITAEEIVALADEHAHVLVVVNTIDRAIELGRSVAALTDRTVKILHSRFYREHRDEITRSVLHMFGRDPDSREPGIVITTQVIEAGVDLSADVLVSEIAPANALIQRWGRCARWGGEGTVIITPTLREPVYPYAAEPAGNDLVSRTAAWLRGHAGSPIPLDATVEQALLSAVHVQDDERWLDQLTTALRDTASIAGQALASGEYALAGTLIRHVQQRTVLVHGQPAEIDRPFQWQGFGVAEGTLHKLVASTSGGSTVLRPDVADEGEDVIAFDLGTDEVVWSLQVPVWDDGSRQNDAALGWRAITSTADLRGAPVVALHPSLARYDPAIGLELGTGRGGVAPKWWAQPVERRELQSASYGGYQHETLEEHIHRMLDVVRQDPALGPRVALIAPRIEAWVGWPTGMLADVSRAAVVLHDAGKLTPAWQETIREWQRRQGQPVIPWLAHSDSPASVVGPRPRFPPHALSGAAHSIEVGEWLDARVREDSGEPGDTAPSPARVLFTAILTHHSPNVRDLLLRREFLLDAAARAELQRLLRLHNLPDAVPDLREGEPLDDYLVPLGAISQPVVAREAFVLAIVTRLLRLSDGWSQEKGRFDPPM